MDNTKKVYSKEQIEELYIIQGLSLEQTSKILGCSRKTLKKNMEEHGISMRGHKNSMKKSLPKILKEDLERMYNEEKLTIEEIAKKLNRDRKTINYHFEKHGIKTRSSGESIMEVLKKRGFPQISKEALEKKLNEGLLKEALADHFGVSLSHISKKVYEHNLQDKLHENLSEFNRERGRNHPLFANGGPPIELIRKGAKNRSERVRKEWENPDTFKRYQYVAQKLAIEIMGRKKGLQIDHIFSVWDGWVHDVHVFDISDASNLRFISKQENIVKNMNSDRTFEEFKQLLGRELKPYKKPEATKKYCLHCGNDITHKPRAIYCDDKICGPAYRKAQKSVSKS